MDMQVRAQVGAADVEVGAQVAAVDVQMGTQVHRHVGGSTGEGTGGSSGYTGGSTGESTAAAEGSIGKSNTWEHIRNADAGSFSRPVESASAYEKDNQMSLDEH